MSTSSPKAPTPTSVDPSQEPDPDHVETDMFRRAIQQVGDEVETGQEAEPFAFEKRGIKEGGKDGQGGEAPAGDDTA